jgi:hypothetical protein
MKEIICRQIILLREPEIDTVRLLEIPVYITTFRVHGCAERGQELPFFEIEIFEIGGRRRGRFGASWAGGGWEGCS